jgi:hypothetical protein
LARPPIATDRLTPPQSIVDGKFISRHRGGRQQLLADQSAAFDEQRQLARREPDRLAGPVAPQLGEAPAIKLLS